MFFRVMCKCLDIMINLDSHPHPPLAIILGHGIVLGPSGTLRHMQFGRTLVGYMSWPCNGEHVASLLSGEWEELVLSWNRRGAVQVVAWPHSQLALSQGGSAVPLQSTEAPQHGSTH